MDIENLHRRIKAVAPIDGVSAPDPADKSTWRVDFKDEATQQERDAAQGVVDAFDVAAAELPDPRIALDEQEAAQAKIDAQIQADLNMTPAEVNSTVDTLFAGFTGPQRTFLKRLVRMVLAAARKVLR